MTHTDTTTHTLPAGHIAARQRGRSVVHAYDLPANMALCGATFPGCLDAFGADAEWVSCAGCLKLMPLVTPPTPPTPKAALIRPTRAGSFEARSSDGHTIYAVSVGAQPSCSCPAGRNARRCYHVTTVERSWAAFWPVPRLPANVIRFRAHVEDLYGPEAA